MTEEKKAREAAIAEYQKTLSARSAKEVIEIARESILRLGFYSRSMEDGLDRVRLTAAIRHMRANYLMDFPFPEIFAGMDRIDKASERIHDLIESHGNVFGCLLKHLRDEITLTERLLLSDEEKNGARKGRSPVLKESLRPERRKQ